MALDNYKQKINARHSITNLGPIHWLLGIKITRNHDSCMLALSQESYIDNIICKFNLSNAKPINTPMTPNISYSTQDGPADETEAMHMAKVPYREAIGSLMYASVVTRPNSSFTVSTLSQFLENLGEGHWEAVKRVFHYLTATRTHMLMYGGERHELIGYTDADGASQDHRQAISGLIYLIDGGTILWHSCKQELVTLSTAKAEYVAAMHAAKEGIWLQ